MTQDFQKTLVGTFVRESLLFGAKHFLQDERLEYFGDLGVNLGIFADEHIRRTQKIEGIMDPAQFADELKQIFGFFECEVAIEDNDDANVLIKPLPLKEKGQDVDTELLEAFYAGIIGSVGAKNFGYCRVSFPPSSLEKIAINLNDSGNKLDGTAIVFKSDDLLSREFHLYEFVGKKLGQLLEKNKALETKSKDLESRPSVPAGKGADLKLFKRNQELEKINIEFKSEIAELGKKNVELAFQVYELEEDLQARQASMKNLEETVEEKLRELDEAQEQAARKELELSNELEGTREYLEKSQAELQNKLLELQNARNEIEALTLRKAELEKEAALAAAEVKRVEERMAEIREENRRLEENAQELMKNNEQLQEEYIRKIEELSRLEFMVDAPEPVKIVGKGLNPFERIREILDSYLGVQGVLLVEKSYSKTGVMHESIAPEDIKKVLVSLGQATKKIASSSQFKDILVKLEELRSELETGAAPSAAAEPEDTAPAKSVKGASQEKKVKITIEKADDDEPAEVEEEAQEEEAREEEAQQEEAREEEAQQEEAQQEEA
ncbi:MAG: hypothetical protein RDV48_14185, partial [Candidatus Eremiobacteraeota bacterium]|nr:hypothetical protein [Candidatus Eremiobacteraeota bacterium]